MSSTNEDEIPDTPLEPEDAPAGARKAAISFILLTLFIDVLGIGIVVPVLPELVMFFIDGENASATTAAVAAGPVALIGMIYALMQFVFAPILGALSDRFGRRPVLLVALFGLGIDFVIQGFAPSITWLFVGRLIAGIMGASFSTANAYIADVSTPATRARNFGLGGMMFGFGFIIGPALGGMLGDINLRLPFFVSAGLALLNWLYGYFVLPESLPVEKRSAFTLAKANPLASLRYLRKYPVVAGLAMAFFCTSLAQRGLENVWVLFTSFQFDWDQRINGWTLGLVGLMAAIVQGGMVRPAIKRLGERKTAVFGMSISAISFIGYGLASDGWMIPVIIVFGAFGGLAGPAIRSIITGHFEDSEQGKIQGAMTSMISLTSILAPLLFTAGLFGHFTSKNAAMVLPGAPFLAGSALIVVAIMLTVRVFAKFPLETDGTEKRQSKSERNVIDAAVEEAATELTD